jgi:nucleoid-associated protein YgaU
MQRTTVQQTMSVAEPVREIVPQIPTSGTVQAVPPPPAPPTPLVAAVTPARSVYANESGPAIPKDAPVAVTPVSVVAVPVPTAVPVAPATGVTPQIVSAESQLMDWQLWDQLRERREESESQPSSLQLNKTNTTAEPALRFTPKSAPQTNTDNSRLHDAAEQFRALMPVDELDPNSSDLETRLPAFERAAAPQPIYDKALPAYRKNQSGGERSGERGMTFRSRINSEIKRSPTEMEKYVVQPGDTYMTISDKFYGTSLLYSALAEHNRSLGIGWKPAEGVVIEIPTAEYLQTYYNQQRRLASQRPAVRYIVQEGDTIFRLATDKLHDTNRWREIYAMNSDRIQDVRDLKPGMEILLPVETARRN